MRRTSNARSKLLPGGEGGSFLRSVFATPSPVSERLTTTGLLAVTLSLSAVLVFLLTVSAVV